MIEVDVLDFIEEALDHGPMVEHLPSGVDLVQLRMRLGTTRHEQRTAIRRRLAGDVIGPDLLGANDDLLLIGPDERAKDGQVDDFVDRHDVFKRLRSDLTEGFPVTIAFAPSMRAMRSATAYITRRYMITLSFPGQARKISRWQSPKGTT